MNEEVAGGARLADPAGLMGGRGEGAPARQAARPRRPGPARAARPEGRRAGPGRLNRRYRMEELRLGPLPLAVSDHGGDGRPVVLLPGGGRTRRDWDAFAGLLRDAGYHPVAVDLRGQGRSGVAPWSWPGALSDVATVVDTLGLDRPAVVGHSLGGMVAALWAARHPECPLAVNVDGLDLFTVYRATRAPLLVVCGVADGSGGFLPEHLAAAWADYRAWVWRELATLAAQVPLVSVVSLPTGHDVHRQDPAALLRLVTDRLTAAA